MDDLEGLEAELVDETEEDGEVGQSDDEDETAGSEDSAEGSSEPDDKRVNDLMSKWQKSEARNKELNERLETLEQKGKPAGTEDNPEEWIQYMRESARDSVYASEPRLEKYGIDPSVIEGDTPASMKASLAALTGLMDRIETDSSNRTLKKAGITPDARGSAAKKAIVIPDNDEDFEAMVQKIKDQA